MAAKPAERCCSLRSTALSSSRSSCGAVIEPLGFGEWVYWQRDSERNPECWTKVFAVVEEDTSVGLYGCEDMSPRTLVCRKSMWRVRVRVESNLRSLTLFDAEGAVVMQLWLLNASNLEIWRSCLESAVNAAPAPPQDQRAVVAASEGSMLSFRGIRHVRTRNPGVSKRSVAKAVCKSAVSQMKRKLRALVE